MKSNLNYSEFVKLTDNKENPFVEPRLRVPSVNNPMMNVPITDYDRKPTYNSYTATYNHPNNVDSKSINDKTEFYWSNKLFKDPADVFWEKNNSQRQWYSTPNGSNPANQTEFAEYLYGSDLVCKSGSIWAKYDVPYTEDSLACTGYDRGGKMTNAGIFKSN